MMNYDFLENEGFDENRQGSLIICERIPDDSYLYEIHYDEFKCKVIKSQKTKNNKVNLD